jgi:hypothetical protein
MRRCRLIESRCRGHLEQIPWRDTNIMVVQCFQWRVQDVTVDGVAQVQVQRLLEGNQKLQATAAATEATEATDTNSSSSRRFRAPAAAAAPRLQRIRGGKEGLQLRRRGDDCGHVRAARPCSDLLGCESNGRQGQQACCRVWRRGCGHDEDVDGAVLDRAPPCRPPPPRRLLLGHAQGQAWRGRGFYGVQLATAKDGRLVPAGRVAAGAGLPTGSAGHGQ